VKTMNDQSTTTRETDDLDTAREDVARAEERLSNRWRAAKVAGERTMGRAMSLARPVAVGAAIVGGVALIVRAVARRRRPRPWRATAPAGPPSLMSEMTRAAALALASAAARHLDNRYLAVPAVAGSLSAEEKLVSKVAG
jgi:hypothetical protein